MIRAVPCKLQDKKQVERYLRETIKELSQLDGAFVPHARRAQRIERGQDRDHRRLVVAGRARVDPRLGVERRARLRAAAVPAERRLA